ncbi:hypothetical protein [Promicromonospora sp. NPDC050262]|uniref:hypothetical protein n=1 Tax=Promicromonospora sp. NPDC050262 TaxID=3155036 RepID=UPI0033DBD7EE
MPTPPRFLVALHRRWSRHPRWALAIKGSLAASLAWIVAVLAPAPFSEQPYYAPLGAIIAMSSTAVRSVRHSAQATGAVLVGAVLAHGMDLRLGSSTLSVALAVGRSPCCAPGGGSSARWADGWRRQHCSC